MIADVYPFGGAAPGSAYGWDYVVLKNRSATDHNLTGHSLVSGPGGTQGPWVVSPLTGTISARGYFLVSFPQMSGSGTVLPVAADNTGVGALWNRSAAELFVGLSASAGFSDPATCGGNGFIDRFEAAPGPMYSGAGALLDASHQGLYVYRRAASGCTDTDNVANDFTVDSLTTSPPKHNGSPLVTCGCEP